MPPRPAAVKARATHAKLRLIQQDSLKMRAIRAQEGCGMKVVKWSALALIAAVVAGFLHWSLPSRDVVRIVGTDMKRQESKVTEGGETRTVSYDIRLINAISPDGAPRVYRNEDTGWGWPPFFKFDSGNLAARADDAVSTEVDPRWVIVTHYGWRVTFLSQYPNALSIRPAEGPDQRLIPWLNMAILTVLAGVALLAWRKARSLFRA
jgi:hypothetical protein